MIAQEFATPGEALAHYGKKGMKWGVRQQYASRRASSAASVQRVGEGKGNAKDIVRTIGNVRGIDIVRRNGIKKRGDKLAAHAQRMKDGKATTLDNLRFVGTVRMTDIVKGKNPKTFKR